MKRLIKSVDLRFFVDHATGDTGLCHYNTQDDNYGTSFNAFWNGIGLFHDVFEHSHEYKNKYFTGEYAMNVGGEMAAMGAMWYYFETLGVSNRMNWHSYVPPAESMKRTTLDMVTEAISDGYTQYGNVLMCNVPKQRPVDSGELEYQIADYWKKVKETHTDTKYEQERESGIAYKESVTFRKIADLHRYGYRMAERLVPQTWDNAKRLHNFIETWDEFCKANRAEEIANQCKGITVKVYKDGDEISWKVTFNAINHFEFTDLTLDGERLKYFSLEEMWVIEN